MLIILLANIAFIAVSTYVYIKSRERAKKSHASIAESYDRLRELLNLKTKFIIGEQFTPLIPKYASDIRRFVWLSDKLVKVTRKRHPPLSPGGLYVRLFPDCEVYATAEYITIALLADEDLGHLFE